MTCRSDIRLDWRSGPARQRCVDLHRLDSQTPGRELHDRPGDGHRAVRRVPRQLRLQVPQLGLELQREVEEDRDAFALPETGLGEPLAEALLEIGREADRHRPAPGAGGTRSGGEYGHGCLLGLGRRGGAHGPPGRQAPTHKTRVLPVTSPPAPGRSRFAAAAAAARPNLAGEVRFSVRAVWGLAVLVAIGCHNHPHEHDAMDGGSDAGPPNDAGMPDAGSPDAGPPDAGLPDAGWLGSWERFGPTLGHEAQVHPAMALDALGALIVAYVELVESPGVSATELHVVRWS